MRKWYKAIFLFLVLIGLVSISHAQVGGAFGQVTYIKSLQDNVVTPIFNISLPAGKTTAGMIIYCIHIVGNTGELQAHSGTALYSGVNKGGVYTTDVLHIAVLEAEAVSAGTLTDTWTITTGVNQITINLNANTSLTPISMHIHYTVIAHHDVDTISLL
jgi:hypothetical protein